MDSSISEGSATDFTLKRRTLPRLNLSVTTSHTLVTWHLITLRKSSTSYRPRSGELYWEGRAGVGWVGREVKDLILTHLTSYHTEQEFNFLQDMVR